jgi:hypothetical protein
MRPCAGAIVLREEGKREVGDQRVASGISG